MSKNQLIILHQNIAGLLNKADLLSICLTDLKENSNEIDVLCITEHFMMQGYEQNLSIPNYTLASCFCRSESKRGGACILIRNEHKWIDLKKITALSVKGLFECCAVELNQHNIAILCVYRVPKATNLDIFMSNMH